MTTSRLVSGFAFVLCLTGAALAQSGTPIAKPATLASRIAALERDNAALHADVDRLQALLVQTRHDMIVMEGGVVTGYVPGPAGQANIRPMSVPAQQAQAGANIQQMGVNQQLNTLQLQQGMAQDRAREQQLFQPAPFGATP